MSIYDRLGGANRIEQMVADFYQTILCDDDINVFYLENVSDIAQLHHTVAQFLLMMFGGPASYKGRDMKTVHKHMPITQEHFDKVWQHMTVSFTKHNVPPPLQQ